MLGNHTDHSEVYTDLTNDGNSTIVDSRGTHTTVNQVSDRAATWRFLLQDESGSDRSSRSRTMASLGIAAGCVAVVAAVVALVVQSGFLGKSDRACTRMIWFPQPLVTYRKRSDPVETEECRDGRISLLREACVDGREKKVICPSCKTQDSQVVVPKFNPAPASW